MKISNIVLCLVPSVALAAEFEQKPAVALTPSAHNLPSASSPELTTPSSIEDLQSDQRIYDQGYQYLSLKVNHLNPPTDLSNCAHWKRHLDRPSR
ncbi:uncharacterized protein NFIA_091440 [Aspergillus fischeri NRRL 181]|uniref:Uncharacterized protein n=1 Tax=Neosartorya fischeri (strain ATCC 1020 / DSM 3700 / CBS 544.65 / FGSC A1164 / JCM 1740 / NRRL 181 / WB 181) TaxID=331117 RepID=A1DIH8_NEOFI|nr:uncharacterized protein NFIA_091440 [Aspergillus fischeri NRRL 181]EAW19185.1 hypothetical protein NFIA_091440 [Aspergillus fischeri NRRL 181]